MLHVIFPKTYIRSTNLVKQANYVAVTNKFHIFLLKVRIDST